VGAQPLCDRRGVAADFIKLDDAQRLVGTVVLQQRLEALGGGQVFECQRPLVAVLTPQHALFVPPRQCGGQGFESP
jgi:hypothetical protein